MISVYMKGIIGDQTIKCKSDVGVLIHLVVVSLADDHGHESPRIYRSLLKDEFLKGDEIIFWIL